MQMMEVRYRMVATNHIGCTEQSLARHHDSAVQQDRVLVRQLRRLLLDHLLVYPPPTGHLHMRLVVLVRFETGIANHAFVGAGKDDHD